MRFGERLQVEYDIADDVESFMVPKLLIQPLVENAIRHGIDPRPEGGKIWISTVRFEQELLITVRDDGVGMNEDEMASLNRAIREQPCSTKLAKQTRARIIEYLSTNPLHIWRTRRYVN